MAEFSKKREEVENLLEELPDTKRLHAISYSIACLLTGPTAYESPDPDPPCCSKSRRKTPEKNVIKQISKFYNDKISKKDEYFAVKDLFKECSVEFDVTYSSQSKVEGVFLRSYKFSKNIPLTEYEKKLEFKEIASKNVPTALNNLRSLALLIEKISKLITDRDFYGKWTTRAKETLVYNGFAIETIQALRHTATILSGLYSTPKLLDFSRSKYDNYNARGEEGETERQIADSVHKEMAEFIIATSLLTSIVENLDESAHEHKKDLTPEMKSRLQSLQEQLAYVLYKLYNNFFCCNRDSQGRLERSDVIEL